LNDAYSIVINVAAAPEDVALKPIGTISPGIMVIPHARLLFKISFFIVPTFTKYTLQALS